jgi:hypothetical protein
MIVINIDKAKTITHNKRREAREQEFKPHDEIIMKEIPGKDLQQAEFERQKIRDKYRVIQDRIDAANTPEELKQILSEFTKETS